MPSIPKALQRLALEIDGWLELKAPERALQGIEALLEFPGARQIGLALRVKALIDLKRHAEALADINELRKHDAEANWLDLREAWCKKRIGDVRGAIVCMERLIAREQRSAIAHYNLGCYLALLGEKQRAIDEISIACGIDAEFRTALETEADLDSLRDDPRFQSLRAGSGRP